jgi:hypothetical protein
MKKIIAIVFLFVGVVGVMGQSEGDWRTSPYFGWMNSNWETALNWEKYSGGDWGVFSDYPGQSSSISKNVSIQNGRSVLMNSNITFATGATCNINSGGSLTIASSYTLTITDANSLVLESTSSTATASLIVSGIVSGTIEAQRHMSGSQWHIISSPVSNQPINTFLSGNSIDQSPNSPSTPTMWALAVYDVVTNSWNSPVVIDSEPTSAFPVGKGYVAGVSSSKAVSFTGTPNVGNESTGVTSGGWNAVGNPYTSSLDIASLISTNLGMLHTSYQSIYILNDDTYDIATSGDVAPGQGFFMNIASGSSLSFLTTMQSHDAATFYKKSAATEEYAEIKLLATSEGNTDKVKIRLYPDQTYGLDPGKDLGKFKGGGLGFILFSQLIEDNGIDFGVQALPVDSIEKMSIPIGLDYTDGGSVTFSSELLDLPVGAHVILEDRLMDEFIDLEATSASYTIDIPAEASGYGRFYLHTFDIQALGQDLNDLKNFSIFAQDKVLYINGSIDESGLVSVYDMMGKQVKQARLERSNTNKISLGELNEGIYIIRLISDNKLYSDKIFLN